MHTTIIRTTMALSALFFGVAAHATIITYTSKASFLQTTLPGSPVETFDPPLYPTAPAALTTFTGPLTTATNAEIVLFGGGGNQAVTAASGNSFSFSSFTACCKEKIGFDLLSLPATPQLTATIDGNPMVFDLTGDTFFGIEITGQIAAGTAQSMITAFTFSGTGSAPIIDNITIVTDATPEPATIAMQFSGLLLLIALARRRFAR